MTGLLATALTGFFVYATLPGATLASTDGQGASVEPAYQELHVAMTAYNAVEAQTDGDPHITAIGAYSDPDIVAARSQDLADELPYGTVIAVVADPDSKDPKCGLAAVHDLIGYRVVADAMHPRMKNKIDILFDTKPVSFGGRKVNPARVLGVCSDVTIQIIGRVDTAHMPRNQAELAAMMGVANYALAGK